MSQQGAPEPKPDTVQCIPIHRDLSADLETPLSAYWKLAHEERFSFLLESVSGGERLARYSLIGVRPHEVIQTAPDGVEVTAHNGQRQKFQTEDPLRFCSERMPSVAPEHMEGMPKFVGGAVGCVGYDYVRRIEHLPSSPPDELNIPEIFMMMMRTVVVFDHAFNRIRIISLAENSPESIADAKADCERIESLLRRPLPDLPGGRFQPKEHTQITSQEQFERSVQICRDYVKAGDVIQVVPSLRLQVENKAHPLSIYRALRQSNPSPYMYLLRCGDWDVVGSSPELLVSLEGREARVRPIAGTRPRGMDAHQDEMMAMELLADEKERAEHLMLVDLGRNDLGRVCEYGSVQVSEFMQIEHYSHVMHIVSQVRGELRPEFDRIDLVRASFPAGTVSGAPKKRAMEIIDELEPVSRGLYAGGVGYLSASGDMDLAIAIRTVVLKDGLAHVQAGAGIVWDSVPEKEYQECLHKAGAALGAIRAAQSSL